MPRKLRNLILLCRIQRGRDESKICLVICVELGSCIGTYLGIKKLKNVRILGRILGRFRVDLFNRLL